MTQPTAATVPANPPFARGSLIWERKGPLPVWGWAALVLVLLLGVTYWRRRSSATSSASSSTASSSAGTGDGHGHYYGGSPWSPTGGGAPATVPSSPAAGGATPPMIETGDESVVIDAKWPAKGSSLWDVADRWLPEGSAQWQKIWDDPRNAEIRAKRGVPEMIRVGDRFYIPGKLATPRW